MVGSREGRDCPDDGQVMIKITNKDRNRIVSVVRMSEAFHREAGESGPFDPSRVSLFLSAICNSPDGAMFVAVDKFGNSAGFLVAQCGANYLTGERMAEETAIYVLPEYRDTKAGAKLYDEFERWAIHHAGAKRLRVTAQSSLRVEAVSSWFRRRGYREVERSFTKEVNN